MADKGDVYYCTWSKGEDGKYVAWELRNPSLRAEATALQELQDKLGQIVGFEYDDHEAALHFDPPIMFVDGADRFDSLYRDQWYAIGWNTHFQYRLSADSAFVGGRCGRCGNGLGPRSSSPLVVDGMGSGTDGAFSYGSNSANSESPGGRLVISDRFLSLLTNEERATFEARQVQWAQPRGEKFFEVIRRSKIPVVAIKGLDPTGWRCDQCGQRAFSHAADLGVSVQVICRADIPSPAPPLLFVGGPTNCHMFTSRQRWHQFCGNATARKLWGDPLAVVDQSQCDRNPALPTLDELAAFRREHGFKVPYRRTQL
jgi:hypothetical protein